MTRRSDRGMTLVELLVAVAIAGVIIPALTQAIFIGLRTLDSTNKRLAGSNDTLLVASYFTSDVEGASYLATAGTRAHVTPAVTLPAAVSSAQLLMFYAVRGATAVLAPPTAGTIWNASGGGLTSSLADEKLLSTGDGYTLARVATTASSSSSVTHTIALTPSGNFARRGESHGAAPNAATLVLSRPDGSGSNTVAVNDAMVAHVTAATTASNVIAPVGWTLVDQYGLSSSLTSLVYRRTATASEQTSWTWRFGSGTHDIAGGIVSYTNISVASPVAAHGVASNPCGGETPLLSIATADNLAVSAVSYFFQPDGQEHQLVRHSCTAEGGSARQVLARELRTTGATSVSCEPAVCEPLPATVTLRLREPALPHETRGRSYVLSARTRTG